MVQLETTLLTVTVQARIEGEWILIDYHTANRSAVDVYSYDAAPGEPGEEYPDFSPLRGLYVCHSRDAGKVLVKRMLGSPPAGHKATAVTIPALFQLKPGQARDVKFKLPLPLADKSEFSPHFAEAKYEQHTAKALELVIGYMALPAGSSVKPFPDNPMAFKAQGAHGPQQFAVATVAAAVPVKSRVDGSFYCP